MLVPSDAELSVLLDELDNLVGDVGTPPSLPPFRREPTLIERILADQAKPKIAALDGEKMDKKPTARRRKSVYRDIETLRILRAKAPLTGISTRAKSPLVREDILTLSTNEPTSQRTEDDEEDLLGRRSKPFTPWRDVGEQIKAVLYQQAVDQQHGRTFTLNLSPHVIAKAKADPKGFMSYVRESVSRHLRRTLGRPVDFWFAIETTRDTARPHLHGTLSITDNEINAASEALAKAAGIKSRRFDPFAVKTDNVSDGQGWALYSTKDLSRTYRHIPGALVTATNGIKRKAETIYEAARNARKYGKTTGDRRKWRLKPADESEPVLATIPAAAPSDDSPVSPDSTECAADEDTGEIFTTEEILGLERLDRMSRSGSPT